ncbi:MAG: glucose 1-dehydrogenase [SAR202 cluster bacterium]|jgi:NAD(P)-dependent dehydrogenase (short-subunit alcohol dehydrogenase family)|nr:glucose 1-dehydrogenase [SAR202 cluster bacterium]|tara:strand:+ start:825 stop:1574 length:750 start_codon:yes stop_codon:yes gene_type:complete
MRLNDKAVLISGGARGMGSVEAKLFCSEGASVIIGDILEEEGRKIEAEISESGGVCIFVRLDVTSEEDWESAVNLAVERFGKLDILINNAGIFPMESIEDTTVESWDRVMDVNAKGVFLGTKAAIPAMRTSGGGSIINLSSIAGLVGSAYSASYNATKGAVRLLTKSTAIQYAKDGIRANSIHPGLIDTLMASELLSDPELQIKRLASTPMGRTGTAEEIAYGALFLASDESSFMTGSELVIDGGFTAQ